MSDCDDSVPVDSAPADTTSEISQTGISQTGISQTLRAEFRHRLLFFLRARLPSEADAEDVFQEVFLKIHRQAVDLREPGRVQAWVYRVARNAVADFYRARGRRGEAALEGRQDGSLEAADLAGPPSADAHEEVLSWLVPMIDELPDGYRQALCLADVEGLTQREVADQLGLSVPGAKSRVQRARTKLGEMLRDCCEVEVGGDGRVVGFQRRADGSIGGF